MGQVALVVKRRLALALRFGVQYRLLRSAAASRDSARN